MKNQVSFVFPGARLARVSRLFSTRARIAACAIFASAALAPYQAVAQSAAQTRVLPLPATQATTVPSNGDVNPYGVAFVPGTVPANSQLQPGSILVSNFNNSANLQGLGTTIVQINSQGQTSLFFTATGSGVTGLTAALGILSDGMVIVGYLPSTDGTSQTAGPGGLLFIDPSGNLLGSFSNQNLINGPWGMAINDQGNGFGQLFVSNVEAGTVVRLDLDYNANGTFAKILDSVTIGSGFMHSGDPAAFEVGPSGLAYNPLNDVLFVASEVDSAVYAIEQASALTGSAGTGTLVDQDQTHFHGPLDLAIAPNGHLIVANSDGRNVDPNQPSELVEFTAGGKFVSEYSVDPANGGAFGVNIQSLGFGAVRVAAVDDNANVLKMWITVL